MAIFKMVHLTLLGMRVKLWPEACSHYSVTELEMTGLLVKYGTMEKYIEAQRI